jgi:Secretion system C-terminal sorting domain
MEDMVRAGLTYINFHTTANPSGEARGQVGIDLTPECLPNGVLELNGEKFTVKVAPNPVSERLNISFESNETFDAQIVISDLTGRQMSVQNAATLRGPNNIDVDMSSLHSGIYFVQLRQFNRLLFTEKVVKY